MIIFYASVTIHILYLLKSDVFSSNLLIFFSISAGILFSDPSATAHMILLLVGTLIAMQVKR